MTSLQHKTDEASEANLFSDLSEEVQDLISASTSHCVSQNVCYRSKMNEYRSKVQPFLKSPSSLQVLTGAPCPVMSSPSFLTLF